MLPSSAGLHCDFREPVAQPISKLAFEFDRRKLTMEDVRELIYREILEYHPNVLRVGGWGVTLDGSVHSTQAGASMQSLLGF